MPVYQYTYAYAAVSPQDGCPDSLVLPIVIYNSFLTGRPFPAK